MSIASTIPWQRGRGLAACYLACVALSIVCILAPAAGQAQQIEQSVESITGQILDSLQAEGKTKIAIIELTDLAGSVTPLGRLVAEELTSQLFGRAGTRLKIVERTKVGEVLGEQRLGVRGLLEQRNVEAFGRILGVEAILTGTIAPVNERVRINARLIAVPSAEVFATAAAYMARLGLPDEYFEPVRDGREPSRPEDGDEVAPAKPVQVVEGIQFELSGCVRSGRATTCTIRMTSLERDVAILLYGEDSFFPPTLVDKEGNSYLGEGIQAGEDRGGMSAQARLTSGVPLKGQVVFNAIPQATRRAAMIEVTGRTLGDSGAYFKAQFLDVDLKP